MKEPLEHKFTISSSDYNNFDEQLSAHGLETQETLRLRNKIKKFFEAQRSIIAQELETDKFSVMVGGSLQAGTADSHSDIDMTLIFDRGDTGRIWIKGGIGETQEGVRGIFLFRPNSLQQELQRDVEVNLLSVGNILKQLENLESLETEEDQIEIVNNITRIFSPQLYESKSDIIDDFRRSIIQKLFLIPLGEKFWDQKIVPHMKAILIERIGDEKGKTWPERAKRDQAKSLERNILTQKITKRLNKIKIPNFQEMREYYRI